MLIFILLYIFGRTMSTNRRKIKADFQSGISRTRSNVLIFQISLRFNDSTGRWDRFPPRIDGFLTRRNDFESLGKNFSKDCFLPLNIV
jgi:hypothetical protein